MTAPAGPCPLCGSERLERLPEATDWVRCPSCCHMFDHWRNAYDSQGRLVSRREGTE